MYRIRVVITLILIVFLTASGCIFNDDDGDGGQETVEGFSESDLVAPDYLTTHQYRQEPDKPDTVDTPYKTAFRYETVWAFQYNTVFVVEGGLIQFWLTNVGDSEMYVYEFGIAPGWLDEPVMTGTGKIILPDEEVELGYCSFPGPDAPGMYDYELKFSILARTDTSAEWTDWGTIGNKSYELDVRALANSVSLSDYKTVHNPGSLYDKINGLVDPGDPAVRSQAVLLAKKYQGAYNVYQLCEIFEYIKNNVSYVNDPRGDDNYWSSPAETLELCAGDCEDQALLFSALIGAISGTTRVYLTDSHAFAAVYMGAAVSDREGVLDAIDAYYGTELRYAWFQDEFGYWLAVDPIGAMIPGGLPLGAEPASGGGSASMKITGITSGPVAWDFTDTEELYIIDIK